MIKKESWIEVYQNDNYLVNIYTGQVKRKETNRILKERIDKKNKKVAYVLSKNSKCIEYTAHRIVMCSYYKKDLKEFVIIHKDHDYKNNNINNLKLSKKRPHNKKIKVIQYKNGILDKIYNSATEFMKIVGIDYRTIKKRKGIYDIGLYRFEIPKFQERRTNE